MSSDNPPSGSTSLFAGRTKRRLAVFAVLSLAVLLGVASVGYAVSLSDDGSQSTAFYLLQENDSGRLVAQNYSTTIPAEQPYQMYVGIENHQRQQAQYTVVIKLQRMYFDNGSARVLEEERLKTVRASVGQDQQWLRPVNVTPTLRGSGMRMVYLLYRDSAPANATMQNAYRETHVWLNVTAPTSDQSASSTAPTTTSTTAPTSATELGSTTSAAEITPTTTVATEPTTATSPSNVDAVPGELA